MSASYTIQLLQRATLSSYAHQLCLLAISPSQAHRRDRSVVPSRTATNVGARDRNGQRSGRSNRVNFCVSCGNRDVHAGRYGHADAGDARHARRIGRQCGNADGAGTARRGVRRGAPGLSANAALARGRAAGHRRRPGAGARTVPHGPRPVGAPRHGEGFRLGRGGRPDGRGAARLDARGPAGRRERVLLRARTSGRGAGLRRTCGPRRGGDAEDAGGPSGRPRLRRARGERATRESAGLCRAR